MVSRVIPVEDFDLVLGNDQNFREDERGFLDYDQRHVVKLNAIRALSRLTTVASTGRWMKISVNFIAPGSPGPARGRAHLARGRGGVPPPPA